MEILLQILFFSAKILCLGVVILIASFYTLAFVFIPALQSKKGSTTRYVAPLMLAIEILAIYFIQRYFHF